MKKYCNHCGSILELNTKWYYVNDKVYCSFYEALFAEQELFLKL